MSRIFVPVCGVNDVKKAVNKAIRIARKLDARVVAIGVLNRELISKLERYKIFIQEESSHYTDSIRDSVDKYLAYAKKVGETHSVEVEGVILEGEPYQAIMDYITANKSESGSSFLVLTKKKQTDSDREVFNQVEKKFILYAPFDIIVVGEDE